MNPRRFRVKPISHKAGSHEHELFDAFEEADPEEVELDNVELELDIALDEEAGSHNTYRIDRGPLDDDDEEDGPELALLRLLELLEPG